MLVLSLSLSDCMYSVDLAVDANVVHAIVEIAQMRGGQMDGILNDSDERAHLLLN